MKTETIHIGSIIKQKVQEKGFTTTSFAEAIHCSRTNVHSIYERKSIDVDFLGRISSVLEFDFPAYYEKSKQENYLVMIESNRDFLENLLSDEFIRVLGFYKTETD